MDAVWNKESMQELIDTNDRAVSRALVVIYHRQTSEERASHTTSVHNKVGFSSFDAGFGSSLAEQVIDGRTLSEKQIAAGRKMIRCYWRQLIEIANEKSEAAAS